MTEKQTGDLKLRVGPNLRSKADRVAKHYGLGTSTLAKVLLDRFCDAVEEHGDQLIWPPQFNHHMSQTTYLSLIKKADEEHLAMVAEESDAKNYGKKGKK